MANIFPSIKYNVFHTSRGGYCSEYQTVYDSFTTKPSSAVAAAQNTMVEGWVADGIWANEDVIYGFAAHTNDDGEALINWKNPGTYDATIVLNGGTMNFIAFEGFQSSDGAYLRTHYIPATDGVKYLQDDASAGIYIRTNVQEDARGFGASDAGSRIVQFISRALDGKSYAWINGGSMNALNADSRGMYFVTRSGVAAQKGYRNKVNYITDNDASVGRSDIEVYILALNNNGVADFFATLQASYFSAGANKTQTNVNNATDIFETYMDSNGKGVIP